LDVGNVHYFHLPKRFTKGASKSTLNGLLGKELKLIYSLTSWHNENFNSNPFVCPKQCALLPWIGEKIYVTKVVLFKVAPNASS